MHIHYVCVCIDVLFMYNTDKMCDNAVRCHDELAEGQSISTDVCTQ